MRVICTAVVDNPQQKEVLLQQINMLEAVPAVSGQTVCVEYEGDPSQAEKFIKLFENYRRHEIIAQKIPAEGRWS